MKNIISFVSTALVLLVASTGFAQDEKTLVKLPVGAKICFEAVSGAKADPNPAAHPQCNGVDNASLARINTLTASLNRLRGRVVILETKVKLAQETADQAQETADLADRKADAAISGVIKVNTKVDWLGQIVGNRVGELVQNQAALATNMDLVSANDGKQDLAIAELKKDMKETKQDVKDLKASGNKLTLRASWIFLAGLKGDTYAAPAVFPGLSLGLGPKTSLDLELGLTANKSSGKSNWGTAFKGSLAYDLDVVKVSTGWATYALGVNKSLDAMAMVSGLEIGVSKQLGPISLDLNVMPVGINYAAAHDPRYAIGGNGGLSYAF